MTEQDGGTAEGVPDARLVARYLLHLIAVFDAARSQQLERRLKEVGLSVPKDRTLGWLSVWPGTTMTDLARGTFIDRTTLTRVVDQLIADGHVKRERVPEDRRKVTIWLTPSGSEALKAAAKATDTTNAAIAGSLDTETMEVMVRGILLLLGNTITDPGIRGALTGRRPRPPPGSEN